MFAADAMVKFTSFAFSKSNSVGACPRTSIITSAIFPTTFTKEMRKMQVERESGGDLARAFDKDEDDERVVTILFFLMNLPFARARAQSQSPLKEWGKYLSIHVGEFCEKSSQMKSALSLSRVRNKTRAS